MLSVEKVNPQIAFGSVEERKLFPVHSNPTRLGIEQGLRGDPYRGPGCYEDDPVSGPYTLMFTYNQPLSGQTVSPTHQLSTSQHQGEWLWSHSGQQTINGGSQSKYGPVWVVTNGV